MSTADVCVGVDERNAMNDRAAMRKVLEYLALGKAVVQFPLAEMQRLCGDATVYARNGDAPTSPTGSARCSTTSRAAGSWGRPRAAARPTG